MLSSRRHRSDETFQDRENLNNVGGNSSYPRSAEAWLDSRCSPDPIDENIFAAEQNDLNVSARETDLNTFDATEEETRETEQEVAFNYSIKNRTPESSPEKSTEAKLMRAKRERIESVVTNIKDKPSKDNNLETFSESEVTVSPQSKKRKMGEQIKQLQRQLDSLQKEHGESEVRKNFIFL